MHRSSSLAGHVSVLHRHGAGRDEAVGMFRNEFGNTIIDHLCGRHRIFECDGVITLRRRRHHASWASTPILSMTAKRSVKSGHDSRKDIGFLLGVDRLGLLADEEMRERNGADIEMWLDELGGAPGTAMCV